MCVMLCEKPIGGKQRILMRERDTAKDRDTDIAKDKETGTQIKNGDRGRLPRRVK